MLKNAAKTSKRYILWPNVDNGLKYLELPMMHVYMKLPRRLLTLFLWEINDYPGIDAMTAEIHYKPRIVDYGYQTPTRRIYILVSSLSNVTIYCCWGNAAWRGKVEIILQGLVWFIRWFHKGPFPKCNICMIWRENNEHSITWMWQKWRSLKLKLE